MAIWQFIIGKPSIEALHRHHQHRMNMLDETWTPRLGVKVEKVTEIPKEETIGHQFSGLGRFRVEVLDDALQINMLELAPGIAAMVYGFPLIVMPADSSSLYWNNQIAKVPTRSGEIALSFQDFQHNLYVISCARQLVQIGETVYFGQARGANKRADRSVPTLGSS